MTTHRARDFLIDRRNGQRSQELMLKCHLSEKRPDQTFRMLRPSDSVALKRLWEQDKLTAAEFSRAFYEVKNGLASDE